MMSERDMSVLKHMIKYCSYIEEAIERFGDSLDVLEADQIFRNSVSMCVLQIGELTTHFSKAFLTKNDEMPWSRMKGMRNIAAHNYKSFSIELLHVVISEKIPELKEYCLKLLEENTEV
jgi:uncharacterized protein with HEPN domain